MYEERPLADDRVEIEEDQELDDEPEWTRIEWCQHHALSVFALVIYPLHVVAATINAFLRSWLASRPIEPLLYGVPAALVLLGAAYLALALQPIPSELIVKYRTAADEAANAGDTEAAELWLKRTLQLNPMDPEHRFNLAMAAELEGHNERSSEMIASLAPENGSGHAPAHIWVARGLMERESPLSTETARRVEHHVLQALTSSETEMEAHAILGQLYFDQNKLEEAIPHLRQAAPSYPRLYFLLAQSLRAVGLVEESIAPAIKARDYYHTQTQESPLVADYRRGWAFSEQILGNHQQAVSILEEGLGADDADVLHKSLVDVYINWYNAQTAGGNVNLAWQLEVLSRAVKHGPKDQRLLTLLAALAMRDWERADEVLEMLKQLVARGVAPAMIHLVIGTQELKKGNYEEARVHLLLAHDRAPEIPDLLNNLAWLLAHKDEPDLPRALELAREAQRISNRPEIADTVGSILALMGRTREAISELETAVRGLPKNSEIHRKLADLYETIGDKDLARIHRELANPP